jgi:hypothetical protein
MVCAVVALEAGLRFPLAATFFAPILSGFPERSCSFEDAVKL